jgi:hypothetical protein
VPIKSRYLIAFIMMTVMSAIYQSVIFWLDVPTSERLVLLCEFSCVFMLVMWVDADSRGRSNIYRPYEFGQLVLLFWLPYLPFYLWRTRRWVGLLMLAGFLCAFSLGNLVVLAIDISR